MRSDDVGTTTPKFRPPAEAVARGVFIDDDATNHSSRGTFRAEDWA